MPLWPFGRKKRRLSASTAATTTSSSPTAPTAPAPTASATAAATATATARQQQPQQQQHDRPRPADVSDAPAQAIVRPPNDSSTHIITPNVLERQGSVQHDLTALPELSELEQSPHLRPANVIKPVHPYTLDRPSSARPRTPTVTHPPPSDKQAPGRRPSNKRKKDQALREEEIRQMSAPMQIPKRPAANSGHDLLQQRAWEIGAMSILSPRPTVRVSGTYTNPPSPFGKRPDKMGKLPELARASSGRKDRRKVADLADDLNSTELRILMERDQRRKEQKALEQHERLDRKLRRRAEKQREEDERRAREARLNATPPTAIHPAFREQQPGSELITPTSLRKQGKQPIPEMQESPTKGGTYLRYPPGEDIPQNPFADPEPDNPFTAPGAEYSPVQTPLDEPILQTARAVRLSAGHMSPPASPVPIVQREIQPSPSLPEASYPQSQRTSSHPASSFESSRRRPSESGSRRVGPSAWTNIFRRGLGSSRTSEDKPPSEFSFVNTSRESMSKQPIPAHLVGPPSSRQSGAPTRTQSKFREDLPELPISPPSSRVQSPELSVITAGVLAARRAKRGADTQTKTKTVDQSGLIRNDSPAIVEDEESAVLSQSYGSVDSEGSWISGRLIKRTSHTSHPHSSLSSLKKAKPEFTASFDRLPVPEHEYFAALTPDNGSRRVSAEHAIATPTAEPSPEVAAPLRQATARRIPTVVHNDPRFKSREGLLTEYQAGEPVTPSREGSLSGESAENSPVELHKAQSVNYGQMHGHGKSLSAGSARMFDITPKRSRSAATLLTGASPRSSPRIPQG
ncbi:unnamed protein product [Aureobasidium uvarum]|uniref:Uncharacterized protein n=1 Tax=Aureobasidium uvarum TaxID=2773716 RepID=A0A9N8KPI1_9PEZI|nr:unnamed protein product [Aureobasidium uvarum]